MDCLDPSVRQETIDLTSSKFFDINFREFLSFANHNQICNNALILHKIPGCTTTTFQSLYFNTIGPLSNCIGEISSSDEIRSLTSFKQFFVKNLQGPIDYDF